MSTDSTLVRACGRARRRLQLSGIPVRFVAEGAEAVGRLSNVSRAGVFVSASQLPRPGAMLVLQFESPGGGLVNVRGEVRWNTHGMVLPAQDAGFAVLLSEPPVEFREFYLWAQELEKPDDDGP